MRMTPEFWLFSLALRRPQREADVAALCDEIAAGPDWNCLIDGARRHRVASILLEGLQACRSPHLPATVVAGLREQAFAAAKRSLAQTREIGRLSRIFAQAEIRVLALKGVVLSAQLFGDPGLRNPRDIDLLVGPGEFADAAALLVDAGYRRSGPVLSPRQVLAHQRWIKDAGFTHATTGINVELHHRLSDNPVLIPCDFDTLWREREEISVGGALTATLPQRHLPLYLCVHGAGHCWEELRWLIDFAAALQQPGATDAAIAAAEAAGLRVPMFHALMLAHDWLAMPVDEHHLAWARADRRVARLDRILSHFYDSSAWYHLPSRASFAAFLRYSLWLRLYTYLLKAEWRYWAYQAMREFVTPADWDTLRLPDSLFWLFPLVRPIGWLVRRWRL